MITRADPIDEDTLRIRHEFLTLPDLHASVDWCACRLGVAPRHALLILESLVRGGFLQHDEDGYARTAPKLPH
jgi:hypothetical protein